MHLIPFLGVHHRVDDQVSSSDSRPQGEESGTTREDEEATAHTLRVHTGADDDECERRAREGGKQSKSPLGLEPSKQGDQNPCFVTMKEAVEQSYLVEPKYYEFIGKSMRSNPVIHA